MKIRLPHVGESVTEGVIGKWLRSVGSRVEKYDPLVEVITDKINMEMPSPASGILAATFVKEGQTVTMGAVIAEIKMDVEEEGTENVSPSPTLETTPNSEIIDRTGVLLKGVDPVGPTGSGGNVSAYEDISSSPHDPVTTVQETNLVEPQPRHHSPAVRRLARENGVDLSKISGSGMNGRITLNDVQSNIETRVSQKGRREMPDTSDADEERMPLKPIRQLTAANMVKSASQIPQAWSAVEVDVTKMVETREIAKADFRRNEGVNLTYMAFMIQATAAALRQNPLLNSSWDGDTIILKHRINIGVAVATSEGLMVPVIHDADTLALKTLAKAVHNLTDSTRNGMLSLEDVQGGTFTINNTGVFGSSVSRALVNYPQAAIMTADAIVKKPVVIKDAIVIRSVMNLGLTFDHRVMDGAEASTFINSVKQRLENISLETAIN